jgi:acetolactate synthase I/II/III large subunit
MLPQQVIEAVHEQTADRARVTTGVGQHQMWTALFYGFDRPRQLATSGGLGTMGFGLPAAVGVQVGCPDELVVCIDGDGSFQMNTQELATVGQYQLPIKVFILNNRAYGMVRQWQEMFFDGRYSHSELDYSPDFVKVAEAYGIKGMRVVGADDLAQAVGEAVSYEGPVVVECLVRREERVLPMVPPGSGLDVIVES